MIYHGVCCVNYQNKATHADMAMKKKLGKETERASQKRTKIMWHTSREIYCKFFEGIPAT